MADMKKSYSSYGGAQQSMRNSATVANPARSTGPQSVRGSIMGNQPTKPSARQVVARDPITYAGPRAGTAMSNVPPMRNSDPTGVQIAANRALNNIANPPVPKMQDRVPQGPVRAPAPRAPMAQSPFYRDPMAQGQAVRNKVAIAQTPNRITPTGTEITIPGGGLPMQSQQPARAPVTASPGQQGPFGRFANAGTPPGYAERYLSGSQPSPQPSSMAQAVAPSQNAGQPQSLGELNNRYQYEKQQVSDGVRALPGRIGNAIAAGDFRNPGQMGRERSSNENNMSADVPDYSTLMADLLARLPQQQQPPQIQGPNTDQLDLVFSSFV